MVGINTNNIVATSFMRFDKIAKWLLEILVRLLRTYRYSFGEGRVFLVPFCCF